MYFDSAYVAKCYLKEADSPAVTKLAGGAIKRYSSVLAIAEVHCVFHRHMRDGRITAEAGRHLAQRFLAHADEGYWNFIPAAEPMLRRVGTMVIAAPANVFLRAADAIHLTTAMELGEGEIWTNDRHMLAAAPKFGLIGRSV